MRLALDKQLDFENPLQRPYDMYCPSIKNRILSRSCEICGLYHGSNKSALNHAKEVHKKMKTVEKKIRPQRVAAHRAKELLCIIKNIVSLNLSNTFF